MRPDPAERRTAGSKFVHIISMIDGKSCKALRRHLSTHGLTPEQYRERYNLKADYPMIAENYSIARPEMAHKIGLGQEGRAAKPHRCRAPRRGAHRGALRDQPNAGYSGCAQRMARSGNDWPTSESKVALALCTNRHR